MGVGRRMKKQGPPEPLSEEHFAKLKRKAGLPVDETPAVGAPASKRRRRNKAVLAGANGRAPGGNTSGRHSNDSKPTKSTLKKPGVRNATRQQSRPVPTASTVDDEDKDTFGSSDAEAERVSDPENGEEGGHLGDEFLGSDSSVFDSDAEHAKEEFVFSDDEDDEDREEKLTAANIEGLSRKLDKQLEQEAADAQAELEDEALRTNIDDDKPEIFDAEAEKDGDPAARTKARLAPDLQLLRNRINETIRVLDDFSKLAEEGRSRAEYTAQLIKDVCAYYGYSEYLAEKLFNLFPAREAFSFFEANESPRPVVIRTNTLKTHRRDLAQTLINRGVVLEPVGKWSKVGLQIFESSVPLGATPEYLAGHYILQAASSFLPVMALAPQETERVLDMAAAPGGKTTHMAALMKNTGVIIANDPNKVRAKGLIGNVHRLGARNVVVCNYDAREFPRVMGGFDRVLLDAPCSGTGVIAKDPTVKTNKTEKDFMQLPHTQKQLLLAAIDSVNHASKTGGYIVYSTWYVPSTFLPLPRRPGSGSALTSNAHSSVTVEENEGVVAYALSRRPNVRLVETGLPFGKEGFTSFMGKKFDGSLRLTRRFYPHHQNVDGFFVAKFKKFAATPANAVLARGVGASPAGESARANGGGGEEEAADRAPIEEDADNGAVMDVADDFGGFDNDEDTKYIERARKNAMRRRGMDPRAVKQRGNPPK